MLNKKFGAILKSLREERRLSQDELGNILHTVKSTISKYEAGRVPNTEILNQISEYFGVKIDYLLGYEEETELLQAIKRVNSDASPQGTKAAKLINTLIETGMIDENGEATKTAWALIQEAIRQQAKEFYNIKKEDANK
ncbi:MAG: helix-turn-helix transcriptional regulator [Bacteroidota bacterium]|nr:helix-turn-helix transcriptional regulator [Bacteroidota bacterium]